MSPDRRPAQPRLEARKEAPGEPLTRGDRWSIFVGRSLQSQRIGQRPFGRLADAWRPHRVAYHISISRESDIEAEGRLIPARISNICAQ